MKFELLDPNVPLGMNVMLVIANVINLIYNIPQMVKTYQTKSTRDFSGWFLSLRVIGYYKVREMVADYKDKQNKRQITDDDEPMIMELSEV
jgi:hypothetical protein